MALYHRMRPKTFQEVIGNEETIEALKTTLIKPDHPHSYLFTGPTGCGKTTLGRIVANELGCQGNDFREVDSADFRGIDTVREIRKQSQFRPLEGSCKVWLIDECFAPGTLVKLANGENKQIECVQIGETVKNLQGIGTVKHVFQNKVHLNRVVKVILANGKELICSKDHKFLTSHGWKPAYKLNKKDLTFLDNSNKFMHSNNSQIRSKNYAKKPSMFKMWKSIKEKSNQILLQSVPIYYDRETCSNGIQNLQNLWRRVYSKMVFSKNNMLKEMWEYIRGDKEGWGNSFFRNSKKDFRIAQNFTASKSRPSKSFVSISFAKNVRPSQSNEFTTQYRKNEKYKTNKWNLTYMERAPWWEWNPNRATNFVSACVGVVHRSSCSYREFSWLEWISFQLQSRYWKSGTQNSNRNRWQGTQRERSVLTRQEKRNEITRIGVDCVEIYQPGSNDQSFYSIIGNKEKNQGFVIFYDLEIEGHPSYYANEILVHNCHKATNDAQNALLKALEDTPKHVYYILCTTDPQKLIATIKGRCSQFQVRLLNDSEMFKLLRSAVKMEEESLARPIYEQIVKSAEGHPRNALQILDQVLSVDPEKRMAVAEKAKEDSYQVIELFKALINNTGWKKVANILEGLKDIPPEDIRRQVLALCAGTLLKRDEMRAGLIMENFIEPFYNTNFPGLVFACYSVMKEE